MAGHRASEPDPSEDRAAEQGLQQERGKGRPRVKEAEETHQRLAFSKKAYDFRLEQVIRQRGKRRGKRDHERELSKKWDAPDLGPSAPFLLLHLRSCTPRRHSATDENGTGHTGATRQSKQNE